MLAGVGGAWGIETRVRHYPELLALDTVDAVLIANPNVYHAEVTIAALQAGVHVLVEKPMCLTLAENDAVIAAQASAGKIVQVGTMRRYAPAFIEACRIVQGMDDIRLARVHDIIGRNSLVIEPTSRVITADDIPADSASLRRRQDEQRGDHEDRVPMMLGRTMTPRPWRNFGRAQTRAARGAAARRPRSATFDYGDFVCLFSTGADNIPRYDTYLEVYGGARVVRVDYDTPFVRNLPITLSITASRDGVKMTESVTQPGWGDAFTEEWRAFHHSLVSGEPAKASPQDFREDLLLYREMIQHMAAEAGGTA